MKPIRAARPLRGPHAHTGTVDYLVQQLFRSQQRGLIIDLNAQN